MYFIGVEVEILFNFVDVLDIMLGVFYIDVVVEDLEVVFGIFVDIILFYMLEW